MVSSQLLSQLLFESAGPVPHNGVQILSQAGHASFRQRFAEAALHQGDFAVLDFDSEPFIHYGFKPREFLLRDRFHAIHIRSESTAPLAGAAFV
jgi:hypothetical protein